MASLAELAAGARGVAGVELEISIDRGAAIDRVAQLAEPGDLVLILGRGHITHEATDARGGKRPLDDRQVLRELASTPTSPGRGRGVPGP